MRVLISGGGTGGHVYPALAVVAQLARLGDARHAVLSDQSSVVSDQLSVGSHQSAKRTDHCLLNTDHVSLLWIGTTGRMEQGLVERAGIPFHGIESGQVRGINPLAALASAGKMMQGVGQSRKIIQEFRPDVCFVTGGYVCAPVVMACRTLRVPVLIYLPDIVPGWAIRMMSRVATRVAVTVPAAASHFGGEAPQGKAVVTGYPVRKELLALTGQGRLGEAAHLQNRACVRRQLAEQLGRPRLAPDAGGHAQPLLLVWGGSQGSRNINQSTWAALTPLLAHAHVVHVVGERDWPLFETQQPAAGLDPALAERYHPVAYLHQEMALALAAADLTLARAGASSLGEFPIARLPSILAPLVAVNQQQNAEHLVNQGAAVMIDDDRLGEQLAESAVGLLRDQARRRQMEASLATLAQPEAGRTIAQELVKLAQRHSR